jgi:phosphatidylinositol glycan class S
MAARSSVGEGGDGLIGEDPEWGHEDHLVLGLAHCFEQEAEGGGKIRDLFLIEPIGASALECMENGGATSYLHVTTATLGESLEQDVSALPREFSIGRFCEDFEFRAKCAARTWKRDHAVNNLMRLAPAPGAVRSDFNFSLADKRIVNHVRNVTDADNIKQDLSIDVYGRKQEDAESADDPSAQVASLYNA